MSEYSLSSRRGSFDEEEAATEATVLLPIPVPAKKSDDHFWTYLRIYTIIFLINISFQILIPAQTKIYEDIYCRQYYMQHAENPSALIGYTPGHIPEALCKAGPIQQRVATLKGWLEFWDALPGLAMAIPIGILADLFGRAPFFNLAFIVTALQQFWITFVTLIPDTIPLEVIWWKGLLNFFSGGLITTEMLFAIMVTDLTPQEKMSNVFFRAGAAGALASVLGPFIAAALMERSAWWAIYAGLGCIVLILPLVFTAPETLPQHHQFPSLNGDAGGKACRLRTALMLSMTTFRELGLVWTDWRLLFLVLLYPFRMMSNALGDLLIRYVSNRYGWSLADATFLYSVPAISSTLVLFLLLPFVADFLEHRFRLSAVQKNVVLSRCALFMIALAQTIKGFAPNVVVLAVGLVVETLAAGSPATLRALAGCMVESKDNGRVFSVLAISETVSNMMAFPATAWLFNKAIEKGGGMWLGLPFFVTAGMAFIAAVAMCCLRFERPSDTVR